MAEVTGKISVIAEGLKAKIETSATFKEVTYGDVTQVLTTPTCCVVPGLKDTDGVASRLDHEVTVYFLIYHGKVQDVQQNQLEADRLAETLEELLHDDPQLGGLVIHGWVVRTEPGYAMRSRTMQALHRVTWRAKTRTYNPFGA